MEKSGVNNNFELFREYLFAKYVQNYYMVLEIHIKTRLWVSELLRATSLSQFDLTFRRSILPRAICEIRKNGKKKSAVTFVSEKELYSLYDGG